MKPIFSDEERVQAVRNYLVACHRKKARIVSYNVIKDYLTSSRVKILSKLIPSGRNEIADRYGYGTGQYKIFYTDKDAQVYYEWLISVVNGTMQEGITEDIIKQANNQLFHFIHIMQNSGSIQVDQNVEMIAPYDWQNLFTSFDERLTDMQRIIDRGDKSIIEVLKPLLELMKKNTKLLDTLRRENERIFGESNQQ